MDQNLLHQAQILSREFLTFVNSNVTAYHVTHFCRKKFLEKGFTELSESQNWSLEKGTKIAQLGKSYFFTKNESTIFAFQVGQHFTPLDTGFKIIAGHTDSPCLKLAPVSKHKSQGFNQSCVTTYGGGLWHTWLDRDLTVAGKVVHFDEKTQKYRTSLYHEGRPLVKIPNLAIHLQPANERGKLDLNYELHLRPVFSTEVADKLLGECKGDPEGDKFNIMQKHYGVLLGLIAKQLGIKETDIVDLDLNLADTQVIFWQMQPAQLVGVHEEFISAPRIDNQMSSFLAYKSLVDHPEENSSWINMICLFDHEECGSESTQGADSNLLPGTLQRIFKNLSQNQENLPTDAFEKCLSKSFQISADMAHSIHPNYPDKHQINHQIKMNSGVGLKVNVNQNYATDTISSSILKLICHSHSIPHQEFIVRNDSPCGSTIGRMISANTGIKTIDVGNPQFAMHSVRETAGVLDTLSCYRLFKGFWEGYQKLNVDLLGK